MGKYFNFVQVMGKNYYLWPFPIFFKTGKIFYLGKPVGDGVLWPQLNANNEKSVDSWNIFNKIYINNKKI